MSAVMERVADVMAEEPAEFVENPADHIGLLTNIVRLVLGTRIAGPVEDSDAYADGLVGLVRACQKFQPELGYKFSTFAFHCIRNEMRGGHVQRYRQNRAYLTDLPDFDRMSAEPSRQHLTADHLQVLQQAVAALPDRTRQIVELRLRGVTFKGIGQQLGISKQRVQQIVEREALPQLRQLLRSEDF